MNILVISGHTDLNDSVANKTILEELERDLPNATFVYLDKLYPDYKIDVETEQEKLLKADVIVFQYPVFWYSMPSLLEKYMEQVFSYGFSHGNGGEKLKGKKLIVSFTTGASEDIYHKDGMLHHEIEDYLNPIQSTALLCGMDYLGYVYTGGVSFAYRTEPGKIEEMEEISREHARKLIEKIQKEG